MIVVPIPAPELVNSHRISVLRRFRKNAPAATSRCFSSWKPTPSGVGRIESPYCAVSEKILLPQHHVASHRGSPRLQAWDASNLRIAPFQKKCSCRNIALLLIVEPTPSGVGRIESPYCAISEKVFVPQHHVASHRGSPRLQAWDASNLRIAPFQIKCSCRNITLLLIVEAHAFRRGTKHQL